jgi:hypothetical protein
MPVNRFLGSMLVCMLISFPLSASERWQLLVLGQANLSLADDHPAYRAAEEVILRELRARDVDAFHPSLVGVDLGCGVAVCPGLSEADLLRAAKSAERPIDMLVLYSVEVSEQQYPAGIKFSVDIPVRLINLENGNHFYSLDRARGLYSLPNVDVASVAFDEWLAGQAEDAGAMSAGALAAVLKDQARRFVFWLSLERIPTRQAERFYQELTTLQGGVAGGVTLLKEGDSESQLLHRLTNVSYSYRSELNGAALRSSMTAIMDDIGINADLSYDRSGRRLTLTQVGIAYLPLYLAAVVGLVFLLFASYVFVAQRAVQRTLDRAVSNRQPGAGMQALATVPPLVPKRSSWLALYAEWESLTQQSKADCQKARVFLESDEPENAVSILEEALSQHSDCAEVAALLEVAHNAVQGDNLAEEAEALCEEDPAQALRLIENAHRLYPRVRESKPHVAPRATKNLREKLLVGNTDQAERALAANQPYVALAAIDQALDALKGLAEFVADVSRLSDLRNRVIEDMPLVRSSFAGVGALEGCDFLVESPTQCGRSSTPVAGSIVLGFRRLSRLGNQVEFLRVNNELTLRHADSKNGVFANENLLKPGASVPLSDGMVVAMGGDVSPPRKGACQINIKLPAGSHGSAVLSLNKAPLRLLSRKALLEAWPTVESDVSRRWVLLGQRFAAGALSGGMIDLLSTEQELLEFIVEDGVVCIASTDQNMPLYAGDAQCLRPVPLTSKTNFQVAGAVFSFRTHRDEREVAQ